MCVLSSFVLWLWFREIKVYLKKKKQQPPTTKGRTYYLCVKLSPRGKFSYLEIAYWGNTIKREEIQITKTTKHNNNYK